VARIAALTLLGMILAGCAAPASPSPTLAPLPYLATTPALRPWVEARVTDFVTERGALDFYVALFPAADIEPALADEEAALAVASLDPPPDWFATPLGFETIAVILHADNPIGSLSSPELAGLFSGRIQNWSEIGPGSGAVQPYIPLPSDEMCAQFAAAILGGEDFTTNAILAPSPRAMLTAISADPDAVGLLPLSLLDDSVKAAAIDGELPGRSEAPAKAYPLRMAVIALAPKEPAGALREWLGWVQANELSADQP
jgi:ABC-type phosphate transport system substrate-binding protein